VVRVPWLPLFAHTPAYDGLGSSWEDRIGEMARLPEVLFTILECLRMSKGLVTSSSHLCDGERDWGALSGEKPVLLRLVLCLGTC
jgi:hypothetical protein